MKYRVSMAVACGVLLAGLPVLSRAEGEEPAKRDAVDVVMGVGLVISPGYNDTLNDAYPDADISGGYGWLDVLLGVRFNATKLFSITPGCDLLLNAVSGDDSYVNTIVLPSLGARLCFTELPSVYLNGEVNYGIPSTGGNRMDTKSGGVGFGGAVGYDFDVGVAIEAGYLYVPVDVDLMSRSSLSSRRIGSRDENFGGYFLRFKGAF